MTMGPPQAEEALRTTLAMGADRAIHLSDKVFAVADTLGTSRTLAMAVEKEGADLVLCGRKTVDSETWQVPPEMAAFLGWPQLTSVDRLELADGSLRAPPGDRRGLRHLRARDSRRRLGDRGDQRGHLAGAAGRRGDADRRPDRGLDGGRPRRRGRGVRPALRPDRLAHAGPRRQGRDARAPRRDRRLARRRPPSGSSSFSREAEDPPASPWEKPERLGEKPGESYDCWTVVELSTAPRAGSRSSCSARAASWRASSAGDNVALVLGHDLDGVAREAAATGPSASSSWTTSAWPSTSPTRTPRRCASRRVASARTRSSSPRRRGPRLRAAVAGELELGMTGDCVDLGIDKAGRLIQYKPAYGGNIVSVIMGATTPQLATVRPGMFSPVEPRDDAEAELVALPRRLAAPRPGSSSASTGRTPPATSWTPPRSPLRRQGNRRPRGAPRDRGPARRLGAAVGGEPRRRRRRLAAEEPPDRAHGPGHRAAALRSRSASAAPSSTWSAPSRRASSSALNANERAPIFEHADVGVVGDWRETLPPLVDALEPRI